MALKINCEILKTIRYTTGNQCRALSNGVIHDKIYSLQIQDVRQSSELFAVFESDTLVSRIRGYCNSQDEEK